MQNSVLLGIMMTLLGNKQVTSIQLAEKYEISRRTVFRYVDVLCQAGVPIYSNPGRHGGFSILDSYKLTSTFFTPTEYNCLVSAVQDYSRKDSVSTLLLDKLNALSRPPQQENLLKSEQLIADTPATPFFLSCALIIKNAIMQQLALNIDYQIDSTHVTRHILPHALLFKNGVWYVLAFCSQKQDFALFVINRIEKIRLTEQSFSLMTYDLDKILSTQLPPDANAEQFTISFTEKALREVENWLGVDSITRTRAGLVASATLPFNSALVAKILTFGHHVKVESPDKLKSAIIKTITQSLDNYK